MTYRSTRSGHCSPKPAVHRVLHVIDLGYPGGAQKVFVDLASRMNSGEWRSLAAVPETGWISDELGTAVPYVITPITRTAFDWRYVLELVAVIRRHGINLVHAHLLGPAVYACMAGMISGVPVIVTFHGQVDVAPAERFKAIKFAILNAACARVVFVSEALRTFFLANTSLRAQLTSVIYNGVDLRGIRTLRKGSLRDQLRLGGDAILVGAIGNLRAPKDYPLFVKAAAELYKQNPQFRFVIIGAPDDQAVEAELHRLRQNLGLQNVLHFTGFRTDVEDILNDLDVYAITSNAEGLSLSTLQALAAGVPVVATRCGGPDEILEHERTGLLVNVGDVDGVVRSIQRIRVEQHLARRLTHAGRARVEEAFRIERMMEQYEEIYRSALGPLPVGAPRRPCFGSGNGSC